MKKNIIEYIYQMVIISHVNMDLEARLLRLVGR